MNEEIRIVPTGPEHYSHIIPVFDAAFLPKFLHTVKTPEQAADLTDDLGLIRKESGGREFVALEGENVLGFLSLKYGKEKEKPVRGGLGAWGILKQYGLAGAIKGLILLLTFDHSLKRGEFYIDSVCVSPEARGKGVGTKLLEFSEKLAREKGMTKLTLMVMYENDRAKALYERYGFQVIGSKSLRLIGKNIGYSGAWVMEKELR